MIRSLAFIILPTSNGVWQRNLDQLAVRMPLFNGRRRIAIFTGECRGKPLQSPGAVREYLRGHDCEFVEIPNDPSLREVAAFLPLFEPLDKECGDGHAIFFAHAKGVTHEPNPGSSIPRWTTLMYEVCLDYWPLVEDHLSRFGVTGAFKKRNKVTPREVNCGFAGSRTRFHYSGTFMWFRAAELFRRPWRSIERTWYGTESYPGCIFQLYEAGCLFHENRVPLLDLYRLAYLHRVEREYKEWQIANQHNRTDWGKLSSVPCLSATGSSTALATVWT